TAARCVESGCKDEVRVAVGRVAPYRLAEPVDRRLVILLAPVRVAEIERVLRRRRVGVGGLREIERGDAGLRRSAAAQLDDAEVVVDLGRAGPLGQTQQTLEGIVVLLERDLRHRRLESC